MKKKIKLIIRPGSCIIFRLSVFFTCFLGTHFLKFFNEFQKAANLGYKASIFYSKLNYWYIGKIIDVNKQKQGTQNSTPQ